MQPTTLNARQLACLAPPVRNETFATIRALGEASVREVAEAVGRSPESVYYHVKALLGAVLIVEKYRRATAHKPEAVYETTAAAFRLPDLVAHPELAPLTHKSVAVGLRHAMRGYLAASKQAESDPKIRESMSVVRDIARLSSEDAETFFNLIEEAVRFARSHESPVGTRLYWSSIVFPDLKTIT